MLDPSSFDVCLSRYTWPYDKCTERQSRMTKPQSKFAHTTIYVCKMIACNIVIPDTSALGNCHLSNRILNNCRRTVRHILQSSIWSEIVPIFFHSVPGPTCCRFHWRVSCFLGRWHWQWWRKQSRAIIRNAIWMHGQSVWVNDRGLWWRGLSQPTPSEWHGRGSRFASRFTWQVKRVSKLPSLVADFNMAPQSN
jgi:hypothetical protein